MTQPLSARAEAGEDAAVLLEQLYDHSPHAWQGFDHRDKFERLLNINIPEAHLAAAMMLIPENDKNGWTIHGTGFVTIGFESSSYGPTPAHALIAAIARTMETSHD